MIQLNDRNCLHIVHEGTILLYEGDEPGLTKRRTYVVDYIYKQKEYILGFTVDNDKNDMHVVVDSFSDWYLVDYDNQSFSHLLKEEY